MTDLDSMYCLRRARLTLQVDASRGARVTEFAVNGRNALAIERPETGSTFWPSPQQAWHWPPPVTLDKSRYRVCNAPSHTDRDCLELESDLCPQTQLRIIKRFELREDSLGVTYRIINCSDQIRRWAPWEISRITGGISFYQSGEPVLASSSGAVEYANGCVWHQYQPQTQQGENQKVFGNGSAGWLANVNRRLLLVKCFNSLAAEETAPNEAEVEIYAHGDCGQAYIELEQQGPYTALAPAQELSWRVTWILSELPREFDCAVGSTDLTDAVHTLVADRARAT